MTPKFNSLKKKKKKKKKIKDDDDDVVYPTKTFFFVFVSFARLHLNLMSPDSEFIPLDHL